MKTSISIVCAVILILFVNCNTNENHQQVLSYSIDLNDRQEDLFKVSLINPNLSQADSIYQFVTSVPGTYQIADIGRFVRSFKAFDKTGNEIKVERKSQNQFRISSPNKVAKIKYEVADIWDSPIKENIPWGMASTSIENDYTLLNTHCVIGYPISKLSLPINLKIDIPNNWKVGTVLKKIDKDTYWANNFNELIDSPILLGRLSYATTKINNTSVDIYSYSKTDLIHSKDLMINIEEILISAKDFLVELPVDHYTFLFLFEDKNAGAWEHSYSSIYVMPESVLTSYFIGNIKSISAHEFFHILTPLNIHSELVEKYDFVTPKPSKHLWLYEGVTEWASDIMQFRSGIVSLEYLLNQYSTKLDINDSYDSTYSLEKIAYTSFTKTGFKQYGNVYSKGAIVATLLDIKILELSKGKFGLREIINQLAAKYGKNNSFPEDDFYKIFVDMTFPAIDDFINNYIRGTEELPLAEYFDKIGIKYFKEYVDDNYGFIQKHKFQIIEDANAEQLELRNAWSRNL